jgi:hypothetical protein
LRRGWKILLSFICNFITLWLFEAYSSVKLIEKLLFSEINQENPQSFRMFDAKPIIYTLPSPELFLTSLKSWTFRRKHSQFTWHEPLLLSGR